MNTPTWIALITLGFVAVAFLAGFCMHSEPHTEQDDQEQADYLLVERIRQAELEMERRQRMKYSP